MKTIKFLLVCLVLFVQAMGQTPALSFDPISVSTIAARNQSQLPKLGPVDAAGNIYYAINFTISRRNINGTVSVIAGTSGTGGYVDGPGATARFSGIEDLDLDAAGNLFVSDGANSTIRKITPDGMVSTLAGNGTPGFLDGTGTAARFSSPHGMALDAAGNIYVVDNYSIRKITQAGVVSTVFGNGSPGNQLDSATNMVMDAAGNFYVDNINGNLLKITPAGAVSNTMPPGYLGVKEGLAIDKAGNLYVSIFNQGAANTFIIYKNTQGGDLAPLAGGLSGYKDTIGLAAQFNYIQSLTIDDKNNIYVSDQGGIRKLSKPVLSFTGMAGVPSPAQYFTISSNYLAGPASLQAPSGYELSLNEAGPYATNLSITTTAGGILVRKIYVRLRTLNAAGLYNDSIVLSAAGAVTQKLGVAGTVTNSPKKLVIIGSGTSACISLNPATECYVGRLASAYNKLAPFDTAIDNHLARGSTNCYNGMPSSYISPYPAGSAYRPLTDINITAALALNPDAVLVNYPTNGYDELSVNEIMFCLRTIRDSANRKGVPCFITTTQPRTSPASFNTPAIKLKLAVLKDSVLAAFGYYAIDFWTGLINPADSSVLYNLGDNINMNAAGHGILAQRVLERNVFTPAGTNGAGGKGLLGTYYSNIDMMGAPSLTRVDTVINNDFAAASPAPGILSQNYYSVRWTGQVQALFSEAYTFYALADDGIRVTVNGVKLIDSWTNPVAEEQSGIINLTAGQKYDIIVEYYQTVDRAVSRLSWSSASTAKAVVPQSQLHLPSTFLVYNAAMEAFRVFVSKNGSQVPGNAAVRPLISSGTSSSTLAGASVLRNDSRIRYIGGHTVENFANIQPGSYPKNQFTTAKNISFSATERVAVGSIVEFDITCPKFEILEYETGGGVRVLVDNKIAGGYSYGVIGELNYRRFDFTAINANPVKRHIRLEYSDRAVLGGLKLDTIGALLPLQDVVNYSICWLGDSFTEGTGVGSNQAIHAGLAAYASKILGFRDYRMSGFGGTGYNTSIAPVFTSVRPSLAERVNYDGINADVYVIAMGINDRESDTALAGKIEATFDNLRATNPTSLIFVLGSYGNGNGANIKPNVENKIISAAANRPGVQFISIYDIAFTKSDATHPDAAGHVTLGAAIASRIKARVGAVDALLQTPVIGSGKGLKGLYLHYEPNLITIPDSSLSNIYLERVDSTINFEFTNSKQPAVLSPAPGIVPVDLYSVRWTGKVQASYSETYTFYTVADDGVRLWVDGVKLVDNWVNQGATERSGTITLVAGRKYDIVMEYYENAGEAVAKLSWSSENTPKAIVPAAQLYPTGFVDPTMPACAVNTTPANGTAVTAATTATLVWNAVPDATSYDVYVWSGATPAATPVANVTTATNTATYIVNGLTGSTLYTWYVIPKNAAGAATGCISNSSTFTTAVPPPPAPGCTVNLTPANNAVLATANTATLTWAAAATATAYDVYIWTGATAPATPTAANVAGTIYNATGLTAATNCNWYVVPKNGGGSAAGCSTTNRTSFITAAPPAPACAVNTSPANGTTIATSNTAVLNWNVAANATSYDVYMWTGATAPATPTASTTTATYTVAGLSASTLYNWYVVPNNVTGAATGCATSSRTSFITGSLAAGAGLQGAYYNGIALSGTPLLTRIDPVINFEMTYSQNPQVFSPAPGIVPVDLYSIRWTGQVQALYSETYTFYTVADDGVRLWVNGVQLVNNWVNQGTTERSGSITLAAGQKYDIVIEYYENTGESVTKLFWSSPSTAKAIVPKAQLYPPNAGIRIADKTALQMNPLLQPAAVSFGAGISPNPVTGGQQVRLQITSNKIGVAVVTVMSSNGYRISNRMVNLVTGINMASINTTGLAQGLYLVSVTGGDKPVTWKLVVE